MSFAVPGVKFRTNDLEELNTRLWEFEEWARTVANELLLKYLVRTVVDAIDRSVCREEELPIAPTSEAYKVFNDRVEANRRSIDGYHSEEDFKFCFVIIPFENRLYGTFHAAQSQYHMGLFGRDICDEYGWNDGDPSSIVNITAEDWAERKRIWRAIFSKRSAPTEVGFTREFSPYLRTPNKQEILANIPLRGERAAKRAKEMIRDERCRGERIDQQTDSLMPWITALFRADDYIATPEGQRAIELKTTELALILPEITLDML